MPKQICLVLSDEDLRDLDAWLAFCRRRVEVDQLNRDMPNRFKMSLGTLQNVVSRGVAELSESCPK